MRVNAWQRGLSKHLPDANKVNRLQVNACEVGAIASTFAQYAKLLAHNAGNRDRYRAGKQSMTLPQKAQAAYLVE